MRIVFGHNHFRLKKVQPHEISLFDRSYDNISFDLWQKYGHLYWIPFIPLGKMWTINKGDGKKYVCPVDIENELDVNPGRSSKKSVFAWSGFLAILIGVLGFSAMEKLDKIKRKHYEAEEFRDKANDLRGRVDTAVADDYLVFNVKGADQTEAGYKSIPLRVLRAEDKRLLLGAYFPPGIDSSISDRWEIVKLVMNTDLTDSFWVDKELVKKAVQSEADDRNFKGVSFPANYSGFRFELRDIKYIAGPEPESNPQQESQAEDYFELVNKGFDAHADSITAQSPEMTCKLSKKRDFLNQGVIALQLHGRGYYDLYLSDKEKHVYHFELDNTNDRIEARRVDRLF